MRLGVTFSHPDLCDDPGFYKEYAQAIEEAGFDHLVAAEHVAGGHPDRLRGEKVHTYDVPSRRPIPVWMGSYFGAIVDRVLRRIARLADGWMPQFPPGDQLADALSKLRGYAAEAGRDPASLGVERVTTLRAGDDPAKWLEQAVAYRELGATHLRVITARPACARPRSISKRRCAGSTSYGRCATADPAAVVPALAVLWGQNVEHVGMFHAAGVRRAWST